MFSSPTLAGTVPAQSCPVTSLRPPCSRWGRASLVHLTAEDAPGDFSPILSSQARSQGEGRDLAGEGIQELDEAKKGPYSGAGSDSHHSTHRLLLQAQPHA